MRKNATLTLSALCVALVAGVAFASDDDDHTVKPGDDWLTVAQITEKLTSEGYDVRQIETEDGAYEVYAIDKAGARIEAYVDPLTGDLLDGTPDKDSDD